MADSKSPKKSLVGSQPAGLLYWRVRAFKRRQRRDPDHMLLKPLGSPRRVENCSGVHSLAVRPRPCPEPSLRVDLIIRDELLHSGMSQHALGLEMPHPQLGAKPL